MTIQNYHRYPKLSYLDSFWACSNKGDVYLSNRYGYMKSINWKSNSSYHMLIMIIIYNILYYMLHNIIYIIYVICNIIIYVI